MLDATTVRAAVLRALDEIKDPCSLAAGTPFGLAEMGLVRSVEVRDDGHVAIALRLTSPFCHMIGFFKTDAARRIMEISEVTEVSVEADNGLDWSPSQMSAGAQKRRSEQLEAMHNRAAA